MIGCTTFEIGNNLFTFLMAIGATLSPVILTLNALLTRKVRQELTTNGGHSVKDAVHRTEATVQAVADSLNVPTTGEHPAVPPT